MYGKGAGLENARRKPVEHKAERTTIAELMTATILRMCWSMGMTSQMTSGFLLSEAPSCWESNLFCSEFDFNNLTLLTSLLP